MLFITENGHNLCLLSTKDFGDEIFLSMPPDAQLGGIKKVNGYKDYF
jgi:hypothetical protein